MSPLSVAILLLFCAYLIGAVPFGYLIGRARGVDLFQAGSGNIGATNAGRVLGRKIGALVFLLDFLKGAVPVAVVHPMARSLAPGAETALGQPDVLRVGAAALAFLGHLFPVYLGFRGGKGIATGAGTMFVLVPGPTAIALVSWIVVLLTTRIVSLASLVAVTILVLAHLGRTPAPLDPASLPITLYLLAATAMVFLKHRGNIRRLLAGNENRIGDFTMRQPILRMIHVLALGLWFGGAAFFSFVTAPLIFQSFEQVVKTAPSDRTANEVILTPSGDAKKDADRKKDLASALAGSAVGPVFPWYFGMQAVCAVLALLTSLAWVREAGRIHRWRTGVLLAGVLTIALAWTTGERVSQLREQRFDPNQTVAQAARAAFPSVHLVSLLLSFVTVGLAGAALAMAARLPQEPNTTSADEYA